MSWYAGVLGEVRDRDILSVRLTKQITDLPAEQVRGSVEAEITKKLAAERAEALDGLTKAMRTKRYHHLVQLLRAWRAAPPFTEAAAEDNTAGAKYAERPSKGRQTAAEGR